MFLSPSDMICMPKKKSPSPPMILYASSIFFERLYYYADESCVKSAGIKIFASGTAKLT